MSPRPPGWPPTWDWFDPTEALNDARQNQRTSDDKTFLDLLQNAFSLQQESANFIDAYLHHDKFGQRPPAYKDVLFGFDDPELTGWNASCGPAEAPARYVIAISAATFLQHYLALDRLLTVPTLLPVSLDAQMREPRKLQFLQIVNGEFRALFGGSHQAPSALGIGHNRHSLLRQLLVYCPFFLFLHELGHIEDGHLDYRAKQASVRKCWPIEQIWESRATDSRCMEFLADANAVLRGAEMVAAALAGKPLQLIISHLRQFGAAVALNMLLVDVADQYPSSPIFLDDMGFKEYPSASLRLAWCAYLFSDGYFERIWPAQLPGNTPSEEAKFAITEGIDQMLRAWDILGWQRSSSTPDDPAIGPPMSELSKNLVSPDGFEWPPHPPLGPRSSEQPSI